MEMLTFKTPLNPKEQWPQVFQSMDRKCFQFVSVTHGQLDRTCSSDAFFVSPHLSPRVTSCIYLELALASWETEKHFSHGCQNKALQS